MALVLVWVQGLNQNKDTGKDQTRTKTPHGTRLMQKGKGRGETRLRTKTRHKAKTTDKGDEPRCKTKT